MNSTKTFLFLISLFQLSLINAHEFERKKISEQQNFFCEMITNVCKTCKNYLFRFKDIPGELYCRTCDKAFPESIINENADELNEIASKLSLSETIHDLNLIEPRTNNFYTNFIEKIKNEKYKIIICIILAYLIWKKNPIPFFLKNKILNSKNL